MLVDKRAPVFSEPPALFDRLTAGYHLYITIEPRAAQIAADCFICAKGLNRSRERARILKKYAITNYQLKKTKKAFLLFLYNN